MTFGEADAKSFMHAVSATEEVSFAIMDRATELGVNFIDTADVYGQDGLSERVVGKWLKSRAARDRVVLATKFRFTMGEGPNASGASRYRIVRCVEESLRRLQTDRIDLYQIHMQDPDTPEEETLRALDDLGSAGKVLYVGASNYAAYRLADSLWTSRTSALASFVTLQAQYSLVVRDVERELVPLCREKGLGILPWSPLASGFLTGKYRKDQPPPEGARLARWKDRLETMGTPRSWRILEACDAVAAEHDASVAQVALAWLLQRPTVSSVIFGARTVAQVDDNVRAAELELTKAQLGRLERASAFPLGYPYEFIAGIAGRW